MSSKPPKKSKPAKAKAAAKPAKTAKPAAKAGPARPEDVRPKPDAPSQAGFTKAEIGEFKALLLHRRGVLEGDVKSLENEAMKRGSDVGDLSTLPMHLADLGTDSFEQEMSLGLMESESDELNHINEAFERIADGSFGLCENCKKRIPKERLRAIPYTRLCVNCKMKEEGV